MISFKDALLPNIWIISKCWSSNSNINFFLQRDWRLRYKFIAKPSNSVDCKSSFWIWTIFKWKNMLRLIYSNDQLITNLFSATIIDRFWLVTSKKCCLNSDSFKVIFNDGNKSQWLLWGKRRQRKCVRKKFCPNMYPRNDQEF